MPKQIEIEEEVSQTIKKTKVVWVAEDGAICDSEKMAAEYEYWRERLIPLCQIDPDIRDNIAVDSTCYWVIFTDQDDLDRFTSAKFPWRGFKDNWKKKAGIFTFTNGFSAPFKTWDGIKEVPLNEWVLLGWKYENQQDYNESEQFLLTKQEVAEQLEFVKDDLALVESQMDQLK